MSLPIFSLGVRFFSLVALVGWVSLILLVDPEGRGWAVPVFFGLGWLACSGTIAWILLGAYRRLLGETRLFAFRWRLCEQSALMGALLTLLVFLQSQQALQWWTTGLAVAFFLLIELSLRNRRKIS